MFRFGQIVYTQDKDVVGVYLGSGFDYQNKNTGNGYYHGVLRLVKEFQGEPKWRMDGVNLTQIRPIRVHDKSTITGTGIYLGEEDYRKKHLKKQHLGNYSDDEIEENLTAFKDALSALSETDWFKKSTYAAKT